MLVTNASRKSTVLYGSICSFEMRFKSAGSVPSRERNPCTPGEAEFQARRESVDRKMIVRQRDDRIQIGVLEDGVLAEHFVSKTQQDSLIGNVYLGKVQNVLPSMEAEQEPLQSFPFGLRGHPNAHGHRVIARETLAYLKGSRF